MRKDFRECLTSFAKYVGHLNISKVTLSKAGIFYNDETAMCECSNCNESIAIVSNNTIKIHHSCGERVCTRSTGQQNVPMSINKGRNNVIHDIHGMLLLLFVFRDLWKESGDSNFQIFSQNCQFHPRRLESLEHFNVLFFFYMVS